ncbi:MAG: hypothetical protein ACE5J1_03160 [Nitrospiria bacterium]
MSGGITEEIREVEYRRAVKLIIEEFVNAAAEYPPFNSSHEGFAILNEEVDELWDEVKKKKKFRSNDYMKKEAIQVGAMAIRFIVDVCLRDEED